MNEEKLLNSTSGRQPTVAQRGVARLARRARRARDGLARNWRDTVYLHERLLEAQRPWEQHATLRWRRQLGGWRMVGSYLPEDEAAGPEAGSRRAAADDLRPARPGSRSS